MCLTDEKIRQYLRSKLDAGVSAVAAAKYKTPLYHLLRWLGEDPQLQPHRLQLWRDQLGEAGYRKATIQAYVKVVNDFLRTTGYAWLCIPRPLRNDLSGRSFGYLTAIAPVPRRQRNNVVWKCVCKCGKEVQVPGVMLLGGNTTSCGCLNVEILKHTNRYEDGTNLRQSLEDRVRNPNSASGYVGVQPKRDKWYAYITYKGVRHNLGTYTRLEDAVKARARAKEWVMEDAARLYQETQSHYGESPRRPPRPPRSLAPPPEPPSRPLCRSNNTSGYPGVSLQHGKWSASITADSHRYRLGCYTRREDAVAARKRGEALIRAGDIETLKNLCTNLKK